MQSPQDADLAGAMRTVIYAHFAREGIAPTSAQLAATMKVTQDEALDALRTLAARRALVLNPATSEIWMAAPFSAVPTSFRVLGAETSWWANCAWDMLGIPAALGQSVRVAATCADCNAPMNFQVDPERGPVMDGGVVHFLVPARHWYDDIGFT